MISSRPRPSPYVWPSWIAAPLASEDACLYSPWRKAHYYCRKASLLDVAAWQVEHDAMVALAAASLRDDGYTVAEEEDNKFAVTSGGITLAGKPDLLAVTDTEVLIVDCKSGARRAAHRCQVMIYMLVLPCVRPGLSSRHIRGMIQYPDGEILIPAEALDPAFRTAFRSVMHTVGGPTPPAPSPTAHECAFCPITSDDCPDRVEVVQPIALTSDEIF